MISSVTCTDMADLRHTKNKGNVEVIMMRVDAPDSRARISRALELILSASAEYDLHSHEDIKVKESET